MQLREIVPATALGIVALGCGIWFHLQESGEATPSAAAVPAIASAAAHPASIDVQAELPPTPETDSLIPPASRVATSPGVLWYTPQVRAVLEEKKGRIHIYLYDESAGLVAGRPAGYSTSIPGNQGWFVLFDETGKLHYGQRNEPVYYVQSMNQGKWALCSLSGWKAQSIHDQVDRVRAQTPAVIRD